MCHGGTIVLSFPALPNPSHMPHQGIPATDQRVRRGDHRWPGAWQKATACRGAGAILSWPGEESASIPKSQLVEVELLRLVLLCLRLFKCLLFLLSSSLWLDV